MSKVKAPTNTLKLTRKEVEETIRNINDIPSNARITYVVGKTGRPELGNYNEFVRAMVVAGKPAPRKITRKTIETAIRSEFPAIPANARITYTIGKTGSKDLGNYNEFMRSMNITYKTA